jgi:type II secretory pathway predicted ATPase ExeA
LEHLEHFSLARDPFRNEVNLEFWFSSRAHVEVGRRLRRCVEQGKELCVLVGEVGSGTTTVSRALIEQLDPDRFEAGALVLPRGAEPDALRAAIALQLGVEEPASGRSEALRQLHGHLVALHDANRRAVVVIDEAQSISAEALAELRALTNLEHDDGRLLTIVLVGSPQLETVLARDPDLLARVELRLRLEALGPADAQAYLSHRLAVAGGDAALFDADVLAAIVDVAGGLPRRLNALADSTLFEAHIEGRPRPVCADVERAARDLPWGDSVSAGITFSRAGVTAVELEKEDDGLGLDDSFEAAPSLESLRDAGSSASFRDLDLPDLEGDLGASVADELENALLPDDDARTGPRRNAALERTVREEEISADLIGPEQTAPGAWRTAAPVDDDNEITASRQPARQGRVAGTIGGRGQAESQLLPDADELDGLFVDLVDEAEPE